MTTRAFASLALLVAACSSTGAEGVGDRNLPTAAMGPFRKLAAEEVRGIAPFVFDDRVALYREPAALAEGDDTILYAVARAEGRDVIVRTRASDGRSFFGTTGDFGKVPPVVLAPDAAWEGDALSGPFVVRASGELLLYYAAAGGIGLARSTDGLVFRKEPAPILTRDPASAWETTEVRAPSVYVLPDGRVRLLYASGGSIGEAESADGVSFRRVDPVPSTPAIEPVLAPAPPAPPGSLLPNEKPPFDTASVGDPCVVLRTTPVGRLHVRVLYTGADASGASAIGFAARYGDAGPLSRQPSPVYSVGAHEAAPAVVERSDGTFLYVHQDRRVDERLTYTAIAAAFSPATIKLPLPADFPERP
ncbi:MAG: hypothetical protein KF819_01370 [Labilithrix sp.]|nr:hypothetical protein [Labilithrix sp.]